MNDDDKRRQVLSAGAFLWSNNFATIKLWSLILVITTYHIHIF